VKAGSIPYPREFGPGATGPDCRAVKRAMVPAANFLGVGNPSTSGDYGMNLKTPGFGVPAQELLVQLKQTYWGLLGDPLYTSEAHAQLAPYFDEFGGWLMNKEVLSLAAAKQRTALVATFEWMIAHKDLFRYVEVRPIPESLPPFETSQEIVTDCSGAIELAYRWTGLADPSKLAYDGEGNTGTLLAAGTEILRQGALPGDIVISRRDIDDEYGNHAYAILSPIGKNVDFNVFSNGYSDDPLAHTFSEVAAVETTLGYPLQQFVRFLPVP
jgi:hypothetical protein